MTWIRSSFRSGFAALLAVVPRVAVARVIAATVVVVALGSPGAALAQGSRELTVGDLALRWAEGDFGSPLLCEIAGQPLRGLRRISIAPPPRPERPAVTRITFVDLEVEEASRCFTELMPEVPNVLGWVHIRLPGRHRPDTAQRDFRDALRRKRGFEFDIPAGSLGVQRVSQPASDVERVSFAGGTARMVVVKPGSDSARLLSGFPTPRKLLLELEAKNGMKLSFPLYLPETK